MNMCVYWDIKLTMHICLQKHTNINPGCFSWHLIMIEGQQRIMKDFENQRLRIENKNENKISKSLKK